jgi:diguanylate cyclase (GGDEF)-like protein
MNCKFLDSYDAEIDGRTVEVWYCRKRDPFVLGESIEVALRTCSSCRLADYTRPPVELVQEVERRNQELVALNAIVSAVNSSLELETVLNTGLDKVMEILQVDAGWISLTKDDALVLALSRGLSERYVAEATRLTAADSLGRLIIDGQETVVVDDVAASRLGLRESRREGLQTLVGVPLKAQGRLLGALFFGSHGRRAYSADDMYFTGAAGAQLASAIEHALLYREQLLRAERERRLLEAAEQLNLQLESSLSLTILAEARRLMDADTSALMIVRGDMLVAEEVLGMSEGFRRMVTLPLDDSLSGRAVLQGVTVAVDDVDEEPLVDPYLVAAGGYRAFLTAPLQVHDRRYGAITVYHTEVHHFTDDEKTMLRTFANQVAIALDNQRLMHEKDAMAVQDGLTGVYNRSYLELTLEHTMKEVHRNGGQVSLLFLDVDDLKQVNDALGHQAGDRLLKEFATLLTECCRETDTVVRYGGDEFVVLMPDTDVGGARYVEQKIVQAMERRNRNATNGFRLSAARGVHTTGWTNAEELLHEADKRMYEMKRRHEAEVE